MPQTSSSGEYHPDSAAFGPDDIRGSGAAWLDSFDAQGRPAAPLLDRIARIKALLTSDGRTPAQGALGWILAQSDRTIPLPGCRTPGQARHNFAVLKQGPLDARIIAEIQAVEGRARVSSDGLAIETPGPCS